MPRRDREPRAKPSQAGPSRAKRPRAKPRRAAASSRPVHASEDRRRPERAATSHGGQSGAEDDTRVAGYVVDLDALRDRPPGPRIAKDPRLFEGGQQAP